MARERKQIHSITSAAPSLRDDQAMRQRRYLISMAIRTICFVSAVVAPPPWRWVLLVGAVTLPYFAVVLANGGRQSRTDAPIPPRRELPS